MATCCRRQLPNWWIAEPTMGVKKLVKSTSDAHGICKDLSKFNRFWSHFFSPKLSYQKSSEQHFILKITGDSDGPIQQTLKTLARFRIRRDVFDDGVGVVVVGGGGGGGGGCCCWCWWWWWLWIRIWCFCFCFRALKPPTRSAKSWICFFDHQEFHMIFQMVSHFCCTKDKPASLYAATKKAKLGWRIMAWICGNCQRGAAVHGDSWWFIVVNSGQYWFLVVHRWSIMVIFFYWSKMVIMHGIIEEKRVLWCQYWFMMVNSS